MKPYWTEPSPAEEMAEAFKRAQEDLRPTHQSNFEEFNQKGWDKDEETHRKKLELFDKLKNDKLSPSEQYKIMNEINKLSK